MSGTRVKTERRNSAAVNTAPQTVEDKEIEEWAKRLAAKPPNQIGQQSTLNNFLNNVGTPVSEPGVPPNNGFDVDSAIGRFTWHTIAEDKYVPCVFRSSVKYCCIRMVEISIIGDLLHVLPSELYDCTNVISHQATQPEAKLLTHINAWHCDGFYGSEPFSTNDLVVSVQDVEVLYSYLSFAYEILHSGGKNKDSDFSKCGFIRVNNDNMIPFTVLPNGEKGVPLFYFEGQTDILKEKATPLTGWELAYLKVCCKVQGVRKDLISGRTLQIVKVSDLKAYFPKRTMFTENCWPTAKSKSLLPKTTLNGLVSTHAAFSQVSSERWAQKMPYKHANGTTAIINNVSVAAPTTNANNAFGIASITSAKNSSSTARTNSTTTTSSTVVISKNGAHGTNNVTMNCNGVPTDIPFRKDLHANSEALRKIKVSAPPLDMSRLSILGEYADSGREGAYGVRLIIIDKVDKQLMHCINSRPFKSELYLVVLQEFMDHFFPSVSIYPTAVSVLKSCGVTTYLPNTLQIRTFNNFGFNITHAWEMPLIPAIEVTQAMSKLKNVFRPRNAAAAAVVYEHYERIPRGPIPINSSRNNGYPVSVVPTKAPNAR